MKLLNLFLFLSSLHLALAIPTRTAPVAVVPHNRTSIFDLRGVHSPRHADVPLVAPMTNAQRLARGLPPRAPRALRRTANRASSNAPRAIPSPIALTRTLAVTSRSGAPLGFVSRALSFGAFGITSDPAQALSVQLAAPADGAPTSVRTLDADVDAAAGTGTPFLGLVAGPADAGGADLAPGSPNYCFVAGTAPTAPGAPPAPGANTFSAWSGAPAAAEAGVWAFDARTGALAPRWVNADGSVADAVLVYDVPDNALTLVGDFDAYIAEFPYLAGDNSVIISLTAV